jgi:hypothetical protein
MTRSSHPATSRIRQLLVPAIVLALAWWVVLIILAWFTANPVTLNLKQIQNSLYVVTAEVDDVGMGQVTVEKEWKTGTDIGNPTIDNLKETGARSGQTYLIPLTVTPDGQFIVTIADLPRNQPLIYPAGTEASRQLEQILSQ